MMHRRRPFAVAALVASSSLLAGGYCTDRGYYTLGGTAPSGQVASGAISRFGSVWVDGAEYATSGASISIDGTATTEAALAAGRVAVVSATRASGTTPGTARSVVVFTRLVGVVTAVDLAAHTLTVLGQTVRVTGDSSVAEGLAPTEPAGLLNGQLLAVDGYRTSTGVIASRIDPGVAGTLLRVSGQVSALNGPAQTFLIGGTKIDYAGVSGGAPAGLATGRYLIASGLTTAGLVTLNATQLVLQDEATAGASGTNGVVHGAVTRYGTSTDFDVAGQRVSTGTTTVYGIGGTVALDVEIEVAGRYDAAGALVADTIAFVPATPFRVVGPVDRIDATAGTFTIAGIVLATANATRWDDRGVLRTRTFALTDLRTGDWVEVRGASTAALAADARVVERRTAPAGAQLLLEDDVASLSDPTFVLAGIPVDTRAATFTAATGVTLTRNQFFAAAAGHAIRVRGSLASGGALVATAVSLRD
jgi:hypothetical protein